MKYFINFVVLFSLFGCGTYIRRSVTISVTNKEEKKEVYRINEIR